MCFCFQESVLTRINDSNRSFAATRLKTFNPRTLEQIPQLSSLPSRQVAAMKAVSRVLPFRVNSYVLDELIDWSNIPDDPIFQLTFPQEGMLDPSDFRKIYYLVDRGATEPEIHAAARQIQFSLNPHPAGQLEHNVPDLNGKPMRGIQHKYSQTTLFFPSQGQTCHAYCTYCFRWAQFVGIEDLKFASREADTLVKYLKRHREVDNVLFTGGDPLVMKTRVLERYIQPLLEEPALHRVKTIRLGSKALAYWPQRFVTDRDAAPLLRLFEKIRESGRQVAVMAHFSHPRELGTPIAREAIRLIQDSGAVIRSQAPLIRHVNDSSSIWARLWHQQIRLGIVPYYMFVERDTGPRNYFSLPLVKALEIFNQAYRQVSGLGRTVRGPSMSATPGKVLVDGVASILGQQVFVLKFLQARDSELVGRPFFAEFDPQARWLDDLKPVFPQAGINFEGAGSSWFGGNDPATLSQLDLSLG